MSLKGIEIRIRELVNENRAIDPDIAIEIMRELLKIVMPMINKGYRNRDIVSIEDMDNAMDELCDFLGGRYIVLDIWDAIWDAKIDRKSIDIEILKKMEKLVNLIGKELRNRINNQ